MSSSCPKLILQDDENENIQDERSIPQWIDCFLRKTFFSNCKSHADKNKNELNRYCITCDTSACRYCIESANHDGHKLLTMYRHVYQDVVLVSEMEAHMDCSNIQPHKCNKQWVISLNPLPHRGSGSLMDSNAACDVCKRKLNNPDQYRFCCIACKIQASSFKAKHEIEPLLVAVEMQQLEDGRVEHEQKHKPRRKGIPHRAPFL